MKSNYVMKNPYKNINRRKMSLGDLVAIVGSCAKDSRETVAAVADLLASGRVVIRDGEVSKRVRVA